MSFAATAGLVLALAPPPAAPRPIDARRVDHLVGALTSGVHWMQVVRHETGEHTGDPALFSPGPRPLSEVRDLAGTAERLISAAARADVVAWARGETTTLDVGGLVEALRRAPPPPSDRLPAAQLEAALRAKVGPEEATSARAVANLAQLIFIEEIRGTRTDDHVRLYQALGLKLNFRQLGLPGQDLDFLSLARELAPRTAPAPFATDEHAWRWVLRLVENWGDKQTGIRDRAVLAGELLSDPAVEPLLPALRALGPRKVAFLGHSMMMNAHWSSLASWSTIAGDALRQLNPAFEYRNFQSGGLTLPRAVSEHLDALVAYRPTETYILAVPPRNAAEQEAFVKVLAALRAVGSRTYVVDDIRPWPEIAARHTPEVRAFVERAAAENGAQRLEWLDLAHRIPGHEQWAAVDRIHMGTEGHLFFARELLKLWAAAAR